ncbi:erythromycin esterase family protein [Bacillus sp. SM2101]|uniref:erythromycin esterase family protein n=1 Tax=Bacillus sp. SM2101 TaxID=2805366 RepID=UPI001BDF3082|nr:erythromycin esterase family protein [Bacillus sp. SM2101]
MKSFKSNIVFIFSTSLLLVILISGCSNQQESESTESSQRITNSEVIETMQYENTEHIKPIELESSDYSDLEFLKDILKDKRVVMLGESSHGVSEYSLIKSRLIKFLHEELDYNVVAFESGLAEIYAANEMLSDIGTIKGMKSSLFSVWHTDHNINLFKYIKEQKATENPINIVGFDMQPQNLYINYYFKDRHTDFTANIQSVELEYYELVYSYKSKNYPENWLEVSKTLIEKYNSLLSQLSQGEPLLGQSIREDEKQWFKKIFEQRIKSLNERYTIENVGNPKGDFESRDKIMSDNLVWLLEEMYPDEKFIVWAHNDHIMKNRLTIKMDRNKLYMNMIEYLPETIKEELYIVGLYMYSGKNTFNNREVVEVRTDHKENSIEYHLKQPGYPVSFLNIDIKDDATNTYWWNSEVTSKFWGGIDEETFIPSEQYDGLIQVEEVNPPNYR